MGRKFRETLLVLFLLLVLTGCGKKEEKEQREFLPVSEEDFSYAVSEKAHAIAVDENGLLYTVRSSILSILDEAGEASQTFEVYDLEGSCIRQKELFFGMGSVLEMVVREGKLYCVVPIDEALYVYVVDTVTWEAARLIKLPGYESVNHMELLGEHLYVLGIREDANANSLIYHPDVYLFQYNGEKISRVDITKEEPQLEKMKVDYPIGMYATEQDTLMVYQYTEENAFCFLEFDPMAMSLTMQEWTHGSMPRETIGGCGDGYVYTYENKMYYGTTVGTKAQLLPDATRLRKAPVYRKGFLFFMDMEKPGTVMRLNVERLVQENKAIRMLTDEAAVDMPYGCGYQMETYPVTPDEFALKVLAQDSDFDAYLLSTREDCAYNLKENGAFYALNEVEGVQEYLDACFPYIKELAVNEAGDIWMIPVGLAIPGIIYSREFCEKNGVNYEEMDYLEFLTFLEEVESETPKLASMAYVMMIEELFQQYMATYDSFDTELCRSYLKKMREIYAEHGEWGTDDVYGRSLVEGTVAEFYAAYNVYSRDFSKISDIIQDSDVYGVAGIPKLNEDIGHVGTMTVLAVNPQAENMEATLAYITKFCEYMLTKQNSFLLADESMYTDTPFIRDQYQLYADGAIDFRMDYEVFWMDLGSYLTGDVGLEEAIAEAERKRKIYLGE